MGLFLRVGDLVSSLARYVAAFLVAVFLFDLGGSLFGKVNSLAGLLGVIFATRLSKDLAKATGMGSWRSDGRLFALLFSSLGAGALYHLVGAQTAGWVTQTLVFLVPFPAVAWIWSELYLQRPVAGGPVFPTNK